MKNKKFILVLALIIVIIIPILYHKYEEKRFNRCINNNITENYIDEDELSNKLGITTEDLKTIENIFLQSEEEKEDAYDWNKMPTSPYYECNEGDKSHRIMALENYIRIAENDYTNQIYDYMNNEVENDIYNKWYANIISGFIQYHLGGKITSIKINTNKLYNEEFGTSGDIVIDEIYNIRIARNGKLGGITFVVYSKNSKFNINKTFEYSSHRSSFMEASDNTAKPIIYIYPEQETEVNIKLGKLENLTCTYPKYEEDGWKVVAKPNGDLVDIKTGRNLYALYWEGQNTKCYDYERADKEKELEGFVVKGENTAEFLEEKLEILGLSERESEEFIVYWLPQMEKNKYNYIRFETKEEIENEMPLEIVPKPETTIRVLMDWKGLDEEIEVKEQKLERIVRKGYTVVEWGGSILNENITH